MQTASGRQGEISRPSSARALDLSFRGRRFAQFVWRQRRLDRIENRPVDVKPGAVELLTHANDMGVSCGLATSTRSSLAEAMLARAGLDRYFSIIVTGDDVRRGKPDPEPYITAAERLGVHPSRCWALEDSANGVRSASAAGCHMFQVPYLVVPTPELRRLGHDVVETLHDVLELLRAVYRNTT